jgi:4,5-DOPA dioxygenase extradiol
MSHHGTPVIFAGHGSPMLAVDEAMGEDFRQWSLRLPRPKTILVFSAHWETDTPCIGETSTHNELIYDFYKFPPALYELQYPAPGAPWLVDTIRGLLPDIPELPVMERGLDHGVWVPLLRLWPAADVPVLQISVPRHFDARQLMALGLQLAPLRQQGVLIMGSGSLTHNLPALMTGEHKDTPEWVSGFDAWVEETLLHHPERLADWETQAPYAKENHPTPEHFLPLLICAGAADAEDEVSFPVTGYEMNLISRRCVQFG